ncbi:tyrosine-type recombinase/integrase [Palleronia sp. KMU-117]|uniref:tyrosine-type recombinase/integrase n=1 Tax=Palleronia sp. KMU-117 TaxID=3434108 RepID=UPI003D763504
MPRQRKGARLYWKERLGRPGFWEIRDGTTYISTGTGDRAAAESRLAEYLLRKYRPAGNVTPDELSIARCLSLYGEEHALHVAAPERIGYAIDALLTFWGDQPVAAITGAACRRYAGSRITRFGKPASNGTIRRELNVLQAALNHCHAEGYLTATPRVTLPPKPPARDRWLTREEAAWLLRGARALKADGRHLADFILHGLYTGSRKATILAMHIDTPSTRGGHVDTDRGWLHRKPVGKAETKKRQGGAPLPRRYLAYLRIQARNGRRFVVEDHRGRRVGDIKTGWKRALRLAEAKARAKGVTIDLSDVTPHTLKHTAISWVLQSGVPIWQAAGYFSTSPETLASVYGHHCPDRFREVLDALDRRT